MRTINCAVRYDIDDDSLVAPISLSVDWSTVQVYTIYTLILFVGNSIDITCQYTFLIIRAIISNHMIRAVNRNLSFSTKVLESPDHTVPKINEALSHRLIFC